jgi:thiamine monophosphate synthase
MIGIGGFASIAKAVEIPALAVGGVTVERAGEVAGAGGGGIAAIGLFHGRESPGGCRAAPLQEVVAHLRQWFDSVGSR